MPDATDDQQRDEMLLRVLKTPPQPRPKRERERPKPSAASTKGDAPSA